MLVCPTRYSSVHSSSLASVHCSYSVIWFEISGVWDTIKITSSSGLLQVIVLCHGDLVASDLQNCSLHILQSFRDGEDSGVGQFKALNLVLFGT